MKSTLMYSNGRIMLVVVRSHVQSFASSSCSQGASLSGSTVVYPYNDTTYNPIELGASIFVGANKNLWRATDEFGLKRRSFDDGDDSVAFWDGESVLFSVGGFPGFILIQKVLRALFV